MGLNPNCNSEGLNLPLESKNCLGFRPSELAPNPVPKGLNPELSSGPGLKDAEFLFSSPGSTSGLAGTG